MGIDLFLYDYIYTFSEPIMMPQPILLLTLSLTLDLQASKHPLQRATSLRKHHGTKLTRVTTDFAALLRNLQVFLPFLAPFSKWYNDTSVLNQDCV